MFDKACCTCAGILGSEVSPDDEKGSLRVRVAKKPLVCCGRIICQDCIHRNPRFEFYCPFCQISTAPSTLPPGLRDPPAYSPPSSPTEEQPLEHPPPYSLTSSANSHPSSDKAKDVIHFVDPSHETMTSISLRYGVPLHALRRVNNLYADHLLAARKTILIPGEYYKGGVSLSPRPVEGEEEELRKAKIRRWMVTCKVADYDVALAYLKQAHYDLDQAVEAYRLDDEWEKQHPIHPGSKGKIASMSRRVSSTAR